MNFTQMYESFQALENPSFWQDIYMRFYRAWFEGDRWMQYFEGLGTTILVTILAPVSYTHLRRQSPAPGPGPESTPR